MNTAEPTKDNLQSNLALARAQIETMRRPKTSMDAALTAHWVLFFYDTTHRVIHTYDGRDPLACLESVKRNHADFEYITCRGMPSSSAAVEWAKAFRLVASLTPELMLTLETLRKSYMPPSAAPAPALSTATPS